MLQNNVIIGYSGHSFVICDILKSINKIVIAYCDSEEKKYNPLTLQYLGNENEALEVLKTSDFFIAIGDNNIREKVFLKLSKEKIFPINAIDATAIISTNASISASGVMIGSRAIVNAFAKIERGVIINTGAIIEHECVIDEFAHIAPGAVLCGNVTIGKNTFVGAGSVIKQGIEVGKNVIIGAGSVVVKNIPDNITVKGNPAK